MLLRKRGRKDNNKKRREFFKMMKVRKEAEIAEEIIGNTQNKAESHEMNLSSASKADASNNTELVLILDRSGSMCGLESDAIGGFNSMVKKQRKSDTETGGRTFVTTVLFDDKYEMLHDHVPVDTVADMTENEYVPRGCTALHDAIGRTISYISIRQGKTDREESADHVVFVIITDGMENASREYNAKTIKKLVEKQHNESDWEFVFLGANIDVITAANEMGIREDMAVPFFATGKGVRKNFDTACRAVEAMAAPSCMRSKIVRGEQ